MNIKLIAVDMDGTILRTDKFVSDRTMAALRKAAKSGCVVLPASGRVANNLPKQVTSIPGIRYVITSNGASVVDMQNRASVYTNLMTVENSNRLLERVCKTGFFVEAYCEGVSYSDRSTLGGLLRLNPPKTLFDLITRSQIFVDDLPRYIASRRVRLEKVNMPFLPKESRDKLYRELSECGEYSLCSSFPDNIEINRSDCSKGEALKHLCETLGIRSEEVMAIGDGGNDLTMLRYAGLGVAMGNAEPDVLDAADCVTATNDEDGAALAIEKYALA